MTPESFNAISKISLEQWQEIRMLRERLGHHTSELRYSKIMIREANRRNHSAAKSVAFKYFNRDRARVKELCRQLWILLYRADIYKQLLPEDQKPMKRYLEQGIRPKQSCLSWVLCNDLINAALWALPHQRADLVHLVLWIKKYAPWTSWGSAGHVNSWIYAQNPNVSMNRG